MQLALSFFDAMPGSSALPPSTEPVDSQPDLLSYNHIIVAFSGGKDSIAAVLQLIEQGAPRNRIELWHHEIDGREGSTLMDWPVTPAYCRAFAVAFDLPLYNSWKAGGFERELLRDDAPTAPTRFETPSGQVRQVGGVSDKLGTRQRFPQTSADLSVRWCSAYLKIDVAARALTNQERFLGRRTLLVTGERAEESPCRALCSLRAASNRQTREPKAQASRRSLAACSHADDREGVGVTRTLARQSSSGLPLGLGKGLMRWLHLWLARSVGIASGSQSSTVREDCCLRTAVRRDDTARWPHHHSR